MVHGYHVIFAAYGYWLPNDPRGAWSDFVRAWELRRFGPPSKTLERVALEDLSPTQIERLQEAKKSLKHSAVRFTGVQARAVGHGFWHAVQRSGFVIWACSILPEHIHLVIGRHRYRVERIAGQLKGEATKALVREGIHPLAKHLNSVGELPSPWNSKAWKVFLDTEESIEDAIAYVERNPIKEGKPAQSWSFVTPFRGLDAGWVGLHV